MFKNIRIYIDNFAGKQQNEPSSIKAEGFVSIWRLCLSEHSTQFQPSKDLAVKVRQISFIGNYLGDSKVYNEYFNILQVLWSI